jgi:hypothetical protein
LRSGLFESSEIEPHKKPRIQKPLYWIEDSVGRDQQSRKRAGISGHSLNSKIADANWNKWPFSEIASQSPVQSSPVRLSASFDLRPMVTQLQLLIFAVYLFKSPSKRNMRKQIIFIM